MIFSLACTPEEAEPIFKITSPATMQFEGTGGTGEITYSLENPASDIEITATSDADWVTDITVGETITFTVAANDSPYARSKRIEVCYGNDKHTVRVNQMGATASTQVSMEHMYCKYYTSEYSDGKTLVYWVGLSNKPFIQSKEDENDIDPADGAAYYQLVLRSTISGESNNWTIPNGTYVFKENNDLQDGSLDQTFTRMYNSEGKSQSLTNVTVTVTNNHIEALMELESGDRYIATYDGPTEVTHIAPVRIGNIYDDATFDLNEEKYPNRRAECSFYGDILGNGLNYHQIICSANAETMTGVYLLLDFFNSDTSASGTYTPLTEESTTMEYTFMPGSMGDNGALEGSWLTTLHGGQITFLDVYAPLIKGTITVNVSGDSCAIVIDCYDEVDNHIQGTYTGPYRLLDKSRAYTPASIMRIPTTTFN